MKVARGKEAGEQKVRDAGGDRGASIDTATHLADPLRVLRQEYLQRVQLLRDTLDVVQSVHTNDDLASLEPLLECLESVLDGIALESIDKLHRLDTDGICADLGVSSLELDAVGHGLQAEDTGAG